MLSAAVLSAAVIVLERRYANEAFIAPSCRIACCQGRRGMRRPTVFEYDYEHRFAEHRCAEQECRLPFSDFQPLKSVKNPRRERACLAC